MSGERPNDTDARVATTGGPPLDRMFVLTLQIGVFVFLMGSWELLSDLNVLDPFYFSRPSDVFWKMLVWIFTGFILPHLAVTLL